MFGSCPSQFLYLLPAPTVVVCVWAQFIRNFRRRETDPISMDNIFVVRNGSTGWRNDAERVPYICEECSGAEPHWVGKHDYRKKICIRGGVLTLGGFPLRHLLVFVVVDVVWRERVCWLHRIFSYYPIDFFLYFFFGLSFARTVGHFTIHTHSHIFVVYANAAARMVEGWRLLPKLSAARSMHATTTLLSSHPIIVQRRYCDLKARRNNGSCSFDLSLVFVALYGPLPVVIRMYGARLNFCLDVVVFIYCTRENAENPERRAFHIQWVVCVAGLILPRRHWRLTRAHTVNSHRSLPAQRPPQTNECRVCAVMCVIGGHLQYLNTFSIEIRIKIAKCPWFWST